MQFAQAKPMIEAFEHYFGEYPFAKDGYKLIEVPYSGMEHQSAVTYGNRFANGYLERDWTGVGISPKFDFIIIHESAPRVVRQQRHRRRHRRTCGSTRAGPPTSKPLRRAHVRLRRRAEVHQRLQVEGAEPASRSSPPRGINRTPPQDMYFKGALFLNTLRSVVDDDAKWWTLIARLLPALQVPEHHDRGRRRVLQRAAPGKNLTPVFDQYLRHAALPALELKFDETAARWPTAGRRMRRASRCRSRSARKDNWQLIQPTTDWQVMKTPLPKDRVRGGDRSLLRQRQPAVSASPPSAPRPPPSAQR